MTLDPRTRFYLAAEVYHGREQRLQEKIRRGFAQPILREVTMHERPIRQLSTDRSSSAVRSSSISNPFINMLEASGNGRSPLVQAEVVWRAFSFGPFRIISHARLVERDGSPMPLDSRAFDLLCVLVSRPGEVVSKGELMAKVLPDLTVDESNLRFLIAQLRRALSDGQGGEGYVTNVSRRGYCFVAPVACAASPYLQHLYGRGDLSC
jgi:DNA-binding winged helix-turn-helix (wHTH) protein